MSKPTAYETGAYWRSRSELMYYKYFFELMRCVAKDATSLLDVGSGNAGYLEWLNWIPTKVSVDIRSPYQSPNVRGIQANIHDMQIERFDICTCLQVLEHVPDATSFARRLFEMGNLIVISVPYKWPRNSNKWHVHDPVDESKVQEWFSREPNYTLIASELFDTRRGQRMFSIFDPKDPERKFGFEYWRDRKVIIS